MSAIFDLDNTLVIKGVKPNMRVVELINKTPDSYIITGRMESERANTEQLLHRLGIHYSALLMNKFGADTAGQLHSKRTNAKELLARGPVTLAVDDDPGARLLYKRLGVAKVESP